MDERITVLHYGSGSSRAARDVVAARERARSNWPLTPSCGGVDALMATAIPDSIIFY